MAVHNPKEMSYRKRLERWLSGECPYCNQKDIEELPIKHGRKFRCKSCNVENKFTRPDAQVKQL